MSLCPSYGIFHLGCDIKFEGFTAVCIQIMEFQILTCVTVAIDGCQNSGGT